MKILRALFLGAVLCAAEIPKDLERAIDKGDIESVRKWLGKCDGGCKQQILSLTDPDAKGKTAISIAIQKHRDDIVALLRDTRKEVAGELLRTATTGAEIRSALKAGAVADDETLWDIVDNTDKVRLFIENGISPTHLLLVAAAYEFSGVLFPGGRAPSSEPTVVALTEIAEVDAVLTGTGDTALILSAKTHKPAAVKALIAKKAALEMANTQGETALAAAAAGQDAPIMQMLLAAGANANTADRQGKTPLMVAAGRGNSSMIRALLAGGARVDARDKEGRTPLIYASMDAHPAAQRVLLEAGAKPSDVSKDHRSVLEFAWSSCDPATVAAISEVIGGAPPTDPGLCIFPSQAKFLASALQRKDNLVNLKALTQSATGQVMRSVCCNWEALHTQVTIADCDKLLLERLGDEAVLPLIQGGGWPNVLHLGATVRFYGQCRIAEVDFNGTGDRDHRLTFHINRNGAMRYISGAGTVTIGESAPVTLTR